jgi:hypothetical protein
MPVCPRCTHPAERALAICTQCGATVPAEAEGRAPVSLVKILFVVLLDGLLSILLVLALEYTQEAGLLGQ